MEKFMPSGKLPHEIHTVLSAVSQTDEDERKKCLAPRTVGTCLPFCGGNIVLTSREVAIGEWRSGPMPTKVDYECACDKCGLSYNAQHFLKQEKQNTP